MKHSITIRSESINLLMDCTAIMLAITMCLTLGAQTRPKHHTQYSEFSTVATVIWDNIWAGNEPRQVFSRSPDGLILITAQMHDFPSISLTLTSRGKKRVVEFENGIGSEIIWAPDSKAFAVTGSNWSGNGPFDTYIYYVEKDGLIRVNINEALRRVVDQKLACDLPDELPQTANIIAIAWKGNSKRLFVAGQVPHHSICKQMGTFTLFEIRLPEVEIVHRYTQAEAKARFAKYLGPELRTAGDDVEP